MNIPNRLTITISLLPALLICLACGGDTTSGSNGGNALPSAFDQGSSSETGLSGPPGALPESIEEWLLAEAIYGGGEIEDKEQFEESFGLILDITGAREGDSTEALAWHEEQARIDAAFQGWIREKLPDALKALEDDPSTAVPFYNEIIRITNEGMEQRFIHETDPEYRATVLRVVGQAAREPIGGFSDLDWDGFHWLLHALHALDVSELEEEQRDMLRVHIAGIFSYVHLKSDERDFFLLAASQLRRDFADFVQDE